MFPLTLRGKELPSKRKVKRKPLAKRKHVEVEYEEELHINRQDAGLMIPMTFPICSISDRQESQTLS
jgi:hypothetical protein